VTIYAGATILGGRYRYWEKDSIVRREMFLLTHSIPCKKSMVYYNNELSIRPGIIKIKSRENVALIRPFFILFLLLGI